MSNSYIINSNDYDYTIDLIQNIPITTPNNPAYTTNSTQTSLDSNITDYLINTANKKTIKVIFQKKKTCIYDRNQKRKKITKIKFK